MHILHISPYMEQGGTERCIINLISQSLKNGYKISLVCPPGGGLKKIPLDVKIYKLKSWVLHKPFNAIAELKEVALNIGKKADLIQVHAAAEMAYLMRKYLPEKPVIFNCHGYDNFLSPYFNYWLASRFLKKVNCSVILNPFDKKCFIGAGLKKDRLIFIPNGVEEKFFNFCKEKNNDKVVGFVGRLVKQKNILWAIKAQAKYRFSPRFLIVGDGPLRSKLEKLTKKLGVNKQIHFLGYKDSIEKVYPLFSYLLVCSRNEAFPLVILEALASGVPVFIPEWLPGLVRLWQNAPGVFVFENGKDLKRQINDKVGKNKEEKIQDFARFFVWENIFKKYQKLYFRVLNGNSL